MGFSLEDKLGVIDDRDNWWKRVREIFASYMTMMMMIVVYLFHLLTKNKN